jgi:hypothetical protein
MQLISDATKTAILQPYIGVGKGLISYSDQTSLGDLRAKSLVQRSLGSRTIALDDSPQASTTSPMQGLYVE